MRLDLETIRSQVASGGMAPGGRLARFSSGNPGMQAAGPSDSLEPAPRITGALRFGTPQRRNWLGDTLMPSFSRDAWVVKVITEGDEHLIVYDTERGLMEPRKEGKFVQTTADFNMAAFGFEYAVDDRLQRQFANAAFRLALGSARRAERAVRLDLENRKAILLSTAALWPAGHSNDESGTPWDGAGGDGRDSIWTGWNQVLSIHPGYQYEDFNVAFSQSGWEAFQNDTAFNALTNAPASFGRVMSRADAATYLSIPESQLFVGDATVNVDGTLQRLWGESVISWLNVDAANVDIEFGSDIFALFHELGGGNAYPPYFTDNPPAQRYPFEANGLPVVHDYTVGYFNYDMKA